jgi:hypothetical protein
MNYIEVMKEALEVLLDISNTDTYLNEDDSIGRKVCCGVVSYHPHSSDCKTMKSITHLRKAIAEAKKESVQEPDWSDSKTLPTELWKNRMYSTSDRLLMADGAAAFEREVNANLRKQLTAPKVPEIDYDALIAASFKINQRWAQGTNGCVAFKHGAEWFRTVVLEAPSHEKNS